MGNRAKKECHSIAGVQRHRRLAITLNIWVRIAQVAGFRPGAIHHFDREFPQAPPCTGFAATSLYNYYL